MMVIPRRRQEDTAVATVFVRAKRARRWSVTFMLFVIALSVSGLWYLSTGQAHAAAPANTAVPLYKNSQQLLGQYPNETILSTGNVNTANFGRVASYPVDGQIY